MPRFGKFLSGGTGHKQTEYDNTDAWETPKDRGLMATIEVNFLRASDSGKAMLFSIHVGKGKNNREAWIPCSLIQNIEYINWDGIKCEINVPAWFLHKEGLD